MVKLNNIVKIYNSKKANEFKALHGVSAEIRDGELIAIIGKSALTTIRRANTTLMMCL